jgi:outer membrane protein assembly factor BamB
MKWSRVFEAPIADPPVVDGSEALIAERADPFVMKLKDTVVSLDLQNGDTRWTFSGANNPGAYSMRQVIDVQASPKYWAIAIRYVMDPHPEEFITVLDRATGQTVYNADADWLWNIAISDDALYHVDSRLSLRRVDLTTKGVHWEEFWRHSHGSRGLFFVDPWLYEFDVERYVNVHRPISGQLVMTGTLSITPARWDVLVRDSYAVVRSQDYGVALFDLQSLSTRWTTMVSYLMARHTNAFWDLPSMSATADSIYLFDARNNLMRIDLLTGKVIWTTPSFGIEAMSRPMAMQGVVYGFYADGTLRAFTESNGSSMGTVMRVPLWYWKGTDNKEWRDLVGGLGGAGDTLVLTTGCRTVYAIQRGP